MDACYCFGVEEQKCPGPAFHPGLCPGPTKCNETLRKYAPCAPCPTEHNRCGASMAVQCPMRSHFYGALYVAHTPRSTFAVVQ
eukprot:scaffold51552_cov28-Tisochrysis_lutea.AAC.2